MLLMAPWPLWVGEGGMAGKPFVSAEGRIVFVITSFG